MKKITIGMVALFSFLSLIAFAQTKEKTVKEKTQKTMYTCSMHPEVLLDKPGKCPKCGMALIKKKEEAIPAYICPMHSEVTSDKPGKCHICGMTLVKKK